MFNTSVESGEQPKELPRLHSWRPWGDHPIIITFLVVIAILGIIPTIYGWLFENDAVIEVKGEASNFYLPKPYISDIKKQKSPIYSTEIFNVIPENTERVNRSEIAEKVSAFLNKDKPNQTTLLDYPENLEGYYELSVTNNGAKEAQDVNLEFPFDGFYEIKDTNPEISGLFSKIIKVGNIRPSNTVIVLVWSSYAPERFYFNKIKVTYPNGSSKAIFAEKATGIWAWGARNQPVFEIVSYIFLLILIIFVLPFLTIHILLKLNLLPLSVKKFLLVTGFLRNLPKAKSENEQVEESKD